MATGWSQSGNGGETPVEPGRLAVAVSGLNASEYPDVAANGITLIPGGSLWTWDGQPGCYDFWQCQNEYVGGAGVIVLPRSVPGLPNVAIQHSSQVTTLRKRWAASREGAPPRLPPTDLGDPNWVFVNEFIAPREMRVAPDGVTIVYEATGVYEYQAIDPSLVLRTANVQPFLAAQAFGSPADPTSVVNWVESALTTAELTGSGDGGTGGGTFGGGGASPLGN